MQRSVFYAALRRRDSGIFPTQMDAKRIELAQAACFLGTADHESKRFCTGRAMRRVQPMRVARRWAMPNRATAFGSKAGASSKSPDGVTIPIGRSTSGSISSATRLWRHGISQRQAPAQTGVRQEAMALIAWEISGDPDRIRTCDPQIRKQVKAPFRGIH